MTLASLATHGGEVIGACLALAGFVSHAAMPYLTAPTPTSSVFYSDVFAVLRYLSGNYGNAAPSLVAAVDGLETAVKAAEGAATTVVAVPVNTPGAPVAVAQSVTLTK